MGTSKTKRLLEFMIPFIKQNPEGKIFILTFRITFGLDIMKKVNKYLNCNGL